MVPPVRLALVLLALAGCDEDDPVPARTTSVATVVTAAPSGSVVAERSEQRFGVLSEEEFKALHELRSDQAPPRRGEETKLSSGARAYLSLPPGKKPPLPGIVVIHEWWGLNEHIQHWADRLAADGYAALAVDLYGGKIAKEPDEAMELMKAVDDKQATATLLEAFEQLASDERVRAEKRGSIGWCFGGKWSLELALAAPKLDAAVVYYGHVTSDPERLALLQAPLLAVFGKRDASIPEEAVTRFEFGLEQAGGKEYRVLRYEADHAFANPSSARYDQAAATAAWQEVRTFLRTELQ